MAEEIVVDIEFKTNVKKISKDLDSVKDSLAETNQNLEDIAKTGKGTETAIGKIGKGFKGMGLAMKGLGIGLIVTAFNALKDIMMSNQTVMDGVAIATETIGVVFNQVVSVVTDVYNAVSESTEGFEGLKAVGMGLISLVIEPLKLGFYAIQLGVQSAMLAWEDSFFGGGDEAKMAKLREDIGATKDAIADTTDAIKEAGSEIVSNLGEAVTEIGSVVTIATDTAVEGVKNISIAGAIETGKALADAKKNEELLEVMRQRQQMQSQLDAELQRQIRDDVSLTFEERIKANEELGKILDEQLQKEQAVADEKVRIAKLELDTNKNSVELQTAYQQALLEQTDIEERLAGQRSEQLTNTNGLIQEQQDAIAELALIGQTEREQEFIALEQDYAAKLELARKAGVDDLIVTEEYEASLLALKEKFRQEDLEAQKQADAEKLAAAELLAQQKMEVEQQAFTLAKSLFNESTKAYKIFALTEIGIDTARAISSLTANSEANPANAVTFGGAGIAQFLAGMIRIVANVKKAKDLLKGGKVTAGGGGGGGDDGGASSAASAAVESAASLVDLSDTPSLTEQFNQNFTNEQPIQAYVVEQNVTSAQQINAQIEQKSTL
jgi:hypothetical protein|tara:strand:+ start:4969 stop:6798 length:1830 start_codon:yes stop_codon:yes gene_type:complete